MAELSGHMADTQRMRANRRPESITANSRNAPEIACLQAEIAHAGRPPELDFLRLRSDPPQPPEAVHERHAHDVEGVLGLDREGRITFMNSSAEMLTGWSAKELIGRTPHDVLHPFAEDGAPASFDSCRLCLSLPIGEARHSHGEVFRKKDGGGLPVTCTTTPLLQGAVVAGAVLLFRDISEQQRREDWERAKDSVLAAITTHASLDTTLQLVATAFTRMMPGCGVALMVLSEPKHGRGLGRTQTRVLEVAALAGLPASVRDSLVASDVSPDDAREPLHWGWPEPSLCDRAVAECREMLATNDRNSDQMQGDKAKSGEAWSEVHSSGFYACLAVPLQSHEGATLGVAAFFAARADIPGMSTAAKSIGELARLAIEHQQLHCAVARHARHDHLTGLPNRLLLEDRLERAILHARRYGTQLAVACIDIDRFKQINDMLGHAVGDGVLREVARLLRESLRDIDTVARQGGDEFLVILPDLKSEGEANTICERILTTLRQPLLTQGQTLSLTVSIGRTVYPLQLEDAADLLRHADIALHTAKSLGRDQMVAFSYDLGERHQRDIELQRELRHALEQKQFYLHYQPLYDGTRGLKGFEALLRWTHPRLGEIGPGEFIPLAEKNGLIIPIGGWVLHEACRQAQEWSKLSAPPVKIFVNVSGVQLSQANFADTISSALHATGLASNLLNLEITETCIVADTQAASSKLRQLRDLGVRISIDDFGCGHSTFSYLQQLPIDTLKIDRSFITCLDGTEKNSAIVRAIVALAEELGLETIAEGVETGLQFDALQHTQCDLFQGFLLAKPLSAYAARLVVLDHAQTFGTKSEAIALADPSVAPVGLQGTASLK